MSQHQRMIQLIKSMSGQSNTLTIPRLYIELTGGDIESALFLSQCVYWSDKTKNKYGFYKSLKEWKSELGLSRFKVYSCAKKCAAWIDVSKHRANNAPTLHYKVNLQKLAEDISSLCDSVSDSDLSVSSKSDLSVSSKSDLSVSSKSITEITQENTLTPQQNRVLTAIKQYEMADTTLTSAVQTHLRFTIVKRNKTHANFIQWLREMEATPEQIKQFSNYWRVMDWRGKQGQPPTLMQVQENWIAAQQIVLEDFNAHQNTVTVTKSDNGFYA